MKSNPVEHQLFVKFIDNVEQEIRKLRKTLNNSTPLDKLIDNFKLFLDKIGSFLSELEQGNELEQKQQIYSHIARFLQNKTAGSSNDWKNYLSAVYFLCHESEPQILIEQKPSIKTERILKIAKEKILLIKVHYQQLDEENRYIRKIEIFSADSSEDKPKITRIEEEIAWDNLLSEVRESFLQDGKSKVSFQIYP